MSDKPNVLIVMSDQHQAGVMGCSGDTVVHTPTFDRLAENGVRFTNNYCNFPLCGPSRMSFMTCRHPHEIESWDNELELSSDVPTFAHAFLAAGYDTVMSGRMHFVGWDQRHGFAERIVGDVPESAYLSAGWKLSRVLGDLMDTPGMALAGITKSGPGRTGYHAYDETVTDATVKWLEERGEEGGDTPFMLTVGYAAPHCPFVAPEEDFNLHADKIGYDDLPVVEESQHSIHLERRKMFGTEPIPPIDAQWRTRVAYYGLCSFLDRQVGEVLDALGKSGLADNTIVVYTSDHGDMIGEHGMWWKSCFYEGASHVPLIISWPGGIEGGRSVSQNVSLMDIGTTLIDLLGIDPLPGATGKSFRAPLEGSGECNDEVFVENILYADGSPARMVKSGPWKYNFYHGHEPELFNLEDDPGELNNLAGDPEQVDVQSRLHELVLRDWDPERIAKRMDRRGAERNLLAQWVKKTHPPEPDPLWFNEPLENRVDISARPKI